MSSPRSPQFALALLLGVAACIAVGGVWLARRTEVRRVPRDHAPLREFARAFDEQLQRLERRYEGHLRHIAETALARVADGVILKNPVEARAAAERIVGVRRLSLLQGDRNVRALDQHLLVMKPPPGASWPEPVLRFSAAMFPQPRERLPEAELFDRSLPPFGWLDAPGGSLYFWERRDWENAVIVLSIDREEVAATLDGWFRIWLKTGASGSLAGLAVADGAVRLAGQSSVPLLVDGAEPADAERPDYLLPLRSRLGTWQLASWDPVETRTSFHAPTLAGTSVLALFTALLGFAICSQQRRALALAAQRVSFVNRVSHELRTPLTNILLNVDLAAESSEDSPQETTRRLALVQEEARRLGRLIDNVLTFSRHERGAARLQPRACVPASVVTAVLAHFAPSFQRHGFDVHTSGDFAAPCLLDADAFAQIIANLLSNVEKYVPGGRLEIAGTLDDGTLTLVIADEGPGIPEAAAERVFRPFERLDSRVNEGTSGTGLGLAIARDLATRMGGSLRLTPSARGAAFELRVPAPPAAEPRSVSAA